MLFRKNKITFTSSGLKNLLWDNLKHFEFLLHRRDVSKCGRILWKKPKELEPLPIFSIVVGCLKIWVVLLGHEYVIQIMIIKNVPNFLWKVVQLHASTRFLKLYRTNSVSLKFARKQFHVSRILSNPYFHIFVHTFCSHFQKKCVTRSQVCLVRRRIKVR